MKVLKKTLPQYHHNLISQEGEIKLIQNPRNCFDVYAGLARERESKYCWSAAHCKTSHPQMQILLTWNPTRQKTQKLYESQIIPQIYFLSLFGATPKGRREEMERYQSKYSSMRIQKRAVNIFWEAPLDQQRDESQEISFNCCHNTAM